MSKPAPAPALEKAGSNSTVATTAQHLHSPAAGATFIASCKFNWLVNQTTTPVTTGTSTEEIKAGEVGIRLFSQGKVRICKDHHLAGKIDDQTKVLHSEDQSAICDLNTRENTSNKVFSISEPCAAPTTGLQSMKLSSGSSSSGGYTIYHRTTFYFENLTADEKSYVSKYLVPSMQKQGQGSSGQSSLDATPDLK